jgi:GH15 family glucan-1,4-alpha-glucosidase
MPLEGFVAAGDPMWLSTLDAIERELVSDSLVYRYNPAASPDGRRSSSPEAGEELRQRPSVPGL